MDGLVSLHPGPLSQVDPSVFYGRRPRIIITREVLQVRTLSVIDKAHGSDGELAARGYHERLHSARACVLSQLDTRPVFHGRADKPSTSHRFASTFGPPSTRRAILIVRSLCTCAFDLECYLRRQGARSGRRGLQRE